MKLLEFYKNMPIKINTKTKKRQAQRKQIVATYIQVSERWKALEPWGKKSMTAVRHINGTSMRRGGEHKMEFSGSKAWKYIAPRSSGRCSQQPTDTGASTGFAKAGEQLAHKKEKLTMKELQENEPQRINK